MRCAICNEEMNDAPLLCHWDVYCSRPCMIKYLEIEANKINDRLNEFRNNEYYCGYCCHILYDGLLPHKYGFWFCTNNCLKKYEKKINKN